MYPVQLEQMGFCAEGTALRLDKDGFWDMDGAVAVNPSGGTLCTNPIAVTGLVRAIDAAKQVMGKAGAMQVPKVNNAVSTAVGGIAQFFNCTLFGAEPYEPKGQA
jgi:acetyl-CoA C-acetyltransferase